MITPIFEPQFLSVEREYLLECIDTGWISSQGRFIPEFEATFSSWNQMEYGVATSNCTTALHLALVALGIGPGDEVLCPDLTFIAPANMICLTGAKLVLIDVEPCSWGIDPAKMVDKITSNTKAVIVVHPFGHAADMDPILELAREHSLKVIEDVAEAPGGLYKGKTLGAFGDVSCYSFFANKILTTGEGGMVLCNDSELDVKLRTLRDHGMSRERKYVHELAGFNYRMTNMQAAIGLAQLERLDETMSRRNIQADHYRARFSGSNNIKWRPVASYCTPVHWLATITLNQVSQRDRLISHLKDHEIDARQMVFPVHMAAPYRDDNNPDDFLVSRSVSMRSLHLPSSTALAMTEVDRICDLVLEWTEADEASPDV
jgi:perosamine synthetase